MARKFGDKPWVEHFWSNIDVRGKDECWLWTGPVGADGYGRVGRSPAGVKAGRSASASRWMLCRKSRVSMSYHLHVLHLCDNRLCVNPAHLEFGTTQENSRQAVERGRIPRGEECPRGRLKNHQAEAIFFDVRPARDVAAEYLVSTQLVNSIRNGHSWKWMFSKEQRLAQKKIREDAIAALAPPSYHATTTRKPRKSSSRYNKNGRKLNIHKVRAILQDNRSLSMIADEYGIDQSLVSMIQRGLRWQHAGLPPNRVKGVPAKRQKNRGRQPKISI